MTIFIIGVAEYIGSYIAKRVSLFGDMKVILIDNVSMGYRDAVKYGKFEYCDIFGLSLLNFVFI